MHLEQLPSGSWRAVVRHAGRRRSVTRRTAAEARFAGAELLVKMGGDPTDTSATVADLLAAHVAVNRDRWSPTFLTEMERVARRVPEDFAARPVAKVTAAILTTTYRRLAEEGWSAHRVKRLHELLSMAWRDAILFEWASSNPCRDARRPRPSRKRVSPPSHGDVRAVLERADGALGVALRLAVATGCRRGEVVAFQWADVDLDRDEIRVRRSLAYTPAAGVVERGTKTGIQAHRTLELDQRTAAVLRAWRARQAELAIANGLPAPRWVVSSDAGVTPWRPDRLTREFGRACAAVDVSGVRLHDLRHYVATTMLQDGVPVIDVAYQLGHASIATTEDVYAHVMPGRGREAAERRAARLG